ncbi:hypothetical protein MGALJ_10110 [Mycobacterium gallinarum]|uniref:HTH cro/C1-type domain-containing protein n=1 Tax=Mycobacterium gallinarum TaxID=39689 RepID=A0A9W4AZM1_9MYCO|nr:hypothetical protein MGALJ_10110 [Mycobacterium gallinarum]
MANSVFYDIADDAGEATNLTARSLLMIAIEQRIQENGWKQAEAARRLGVQQPRVSDLMNGKIDKFSLDALVNMLPAVGLMVTVGPTTGKQGPVRLAGLTGGLTTTRRSVAAENVQTPRLARRVPAAAKARKSTGAKAAKK